MMMMCIWTGALVTAALSGSAMANSQDSLKVTVTLSEGEVRLREAVDIEVAVTDAAGLSDNAGWIVLYSDLDGQLSDLDSGEAGVAMVDGRGRLRTHFDTPGERVLVALAVDGVAASGVGSTSLTVTPLAPPTALVSSPLEDEVFEVGQPIPLSAEITRAGEGDVFAIWSSVWDGPLVPGNGDVLGVPLTVTGDRVEFSVDDLTVGRHLLVLRLWDEDGNISTTLREVEVR